MSCLVSLALFSFNSEPEVRQPLHSERRDSTWIRGGKEILSAMCPNLTVASLFFIATVGKVGTARGLPGSAQPLVRRLLSLGPLGRRRYTVVAGEPVHLPIFPLRPCHRRSFPSSSLSPVV